MREVGYVLHKAIAAATPLVVLLELHKLELAEGLEYRLQVLLGNVEVDVANVETVEGDRIGVTATLSCAYLAVLLGLGELYDDGDT